jgi:hypothetical protein
MATQQPINKTGGRPAKPKSAATLAKLQNEFDAANGVELLDGASICLVAHPNWENGYVADKAKQKHTYHVERKFEVGDESALKRPTDNAQLLIARTSFVFATPEYLEEKAITAEATRWRNLAAAIGKGLADASNKGVTIEHIEQWIEGVEGRKWLFKRFDGTGVVFCEETDKGAVCFADVNETSQKTIRKHLAAAKKRAGIADPDAPLDLSTVTICWNSSARSKPN